MQHNGTKYFACRSPLRTLGMGSIGQKSTLLEHGHVAYQVQVSHHFAADPTPDPWIGVKGQNSTFFQNIVMLHIKLKGIWNAATW